MLITRPTRRSVILIFLYYRQELHMAYELELNLFLTRMSCCEVRLYSLYGHRSRFRVWVGTLNLAVPLVFSISVGLCWHSFHLTSITRITPQYNNYTHTLTHEISAYLQYRSCCNVDRRTGVEIENKYPNALNVPRVRIRNTHRFRFMTYRVC